MIKEISSHDSKTKCHRQCMKYESCAEEWGYSWKLGIEECFKKNADSWDNLVHSTLTQSELNRDFDSGFGSTEGTPFTLWTKKYVYFPVSYDGSEWVGYVERFPSDHKTDHWGAG